MKKLLFIATALMLLTASQCEPDTQGPCEEERPAAAIITDFPDSIKVGNEHDLGVDFVLENSCGQFERFDETLTNKTYEIKLITKYAGCSCNLEFEEAEAFYKIDIDFPGVYELKFWQADGDYDTRVLTVYE